MHFLSNTYTRWLPATGVEEMHTSALVGALEAIDSGVTTILDSCETFPSAAHAEAELQALKDSGIRAFYCYGMSDYSYGEVKGGKAGWEARMAHVKKLRDDNPDRDSLVQVGLALSQIGTVPFDMTVAEVKLAKEREMLCCSHTAGVRNSVITNGLEELNDNNLLFPGHVYIHCTGLTERDMDLIADSGGKISIAMETDMQMGMGIPPLRDCLNRGLKPSLSIDTSAAVAPDLLSQMRLALQTLRLLDHDAEQNQRKVPLHLKASVSDALGWATRNGAEAVGLGDKIGTLTPGKRADIVVISNKRGLSASAFPLGTAVLHSTPADVETVMIDGKVVKRDGRLVGQDVEAIRAKARKGLQNILENMKSMPAEMNPSEFRAYHLGAERMTRANLALAYDAGHRAGDWLRPV
ncbi:amidohydrolase [Colletotrichum truncatum]|uniref:Amidohydrolase n=1 Tax=Colletotrichum truncatum TaxID=5467 RepID=A0ACC3YE12_COLTU|nr:amidohydrolase [Colletotrichum truncatum]KAF6790215.1 amidohydrolase [Colletotrichum truncatum]